MKTLTSSRSRKIGMALRALAIAALAAGPAAHAQVAGGAIAYSRFTSASTSQLWVMNGDGSGARRLPTNLDGLYPAWSHDGRRIAVSSPEPNRPNVMSQQVYDIDPATGAARQLTHFFDQVSNQWHGYTIPVSKSYSPDGSQIAVVALNHVGTVDGTTGSTTHPVLQVYRTADGMLLGTVADFSSWDFHQGDGVDWSPRSNLLAAPGDARLYLQGTGAASTTAAIFVAPPVEDAAGRGLAKQISFPKGWMSSAGPMGWEMDFGPAFSPDGTKIAYIRDYTEMPYAGLNDYTTPSIRIVNVDGTGDHQVAYAAKGLFISRVDWSPDGRKLVFDLARQAAINGWPTNLPDPATIVLKTMNPDGSGIVQISANGVPSGLGAWNPQAVTVVPTPAISSLAPASVTAGSAAFTLAVNGSNFVPGSVVRWNGANLTTAFVSATRLNAAVPGANVAVGKSVAVTVYTAGAPLSAAKTFTVNNPLPRITALGPASVTAGTAAFTLTVNGSGFVSTSVVRWNGQALTTAYVSSAQLRAAVPAAQIATGGSFPITVANPAPAGGVSGTVNLTVNNPVPVVSSLSPASAKAGSAALTLTVNGSRFVKTSVVRWNGVNLATTFVSATQLRAAVPAARLTAKGSFAITVANPAPAGGVSAAVTFTVN